MTADYSPLVHDRDEDHGTYANVDYLLWGGRTQE